MTSAPPGWTDEPAFPDDAVEVGRILGAWGVKGWLKVQPFSADPKALFSARRWFLKPPEGPGSSPGRGGRGPPCHPFEAGRYITPERTA